MPTLLIRRWLGFSRAWVLLATAAMLLPQMITAMETQRALANIRVMLRENHRDDAVRSLAEFRKMYPDYHLPDDLRDLGNP